jgi:hypothetical protein
MDFGQGVSQKLAEILLLGFLGGDASYCWWVRRGKAGVKPIFREIFRCFGFFVCFWPGYCF